jgi:hypothetical protein
MTDKPTTTAPEIPDAPTTQGSGDDREQTRTAQQQQIEARATQSIPAVSAPSSVTPQTSLQQRFTQQYANAFLQANQRMVNSGDVYSAGIPVTAYFQSEHDIVYEIWKRQLRLAAVLNAQTQAPEPISVMLLDMLNYVGYLWAYKRMHTNAEAPAGTDTQGTFTFHYIEGFKAAQELSATRDVYAGAMPTAAYYPHGERDLLYEARKRSLRLLSLTSQVPDAKINAALADCTLDLMNYIAQWWSYRTCNIDAGSVIMEALCS